MNSVLDPIEDHFYDYFRKIERFTEEHNIQRIGSPSALNTLFEELDWILWIEDTMAWD